MLQRLSYLSVVMLLGVCVGLQAQHSDTLQAVHIYTIPWQNYAVAAKIVAMDSSFLAQNPQRSLAEALQQQSALAIRQYGNGMLATIAFRGTSPNHTAVLWNGINLNSATLGQTDLSLIPLTGQENITIQYGASSTLYGSDAVGGSIYLHNEPTFLLTKKLIFQQNMGSFGHFLSSINSHISTHKLESKTHFYWSETQNNFRFRNITKIGSPIEQQTHAQLKRQGLMQELYYKIATHRHLAFRFWYNGINRQIQPTMAVQNAEETQKDRNIRLLLDYAHRHRLGLWQLKLAYLYDELWYKQTDLAHSHQLLPQLRYETSLHPTIKLQTGIQTQWIEAHTPYYKRFVQETRTDIFALVAYQIRANWRINGHLRQSFVGTKANPFTPLVSCHWQIYANTKQKWLLKNSLSQSFRVPTLNERFWQPGGNPNIRPEAGSHAEIGLVWERDNKHWQWQTELTHYQNWVNNWIIWLPQSANIWSPQNVQKVHSRGFEAQLQLTHKRPQATYKHSLQYAYTKATYTAQHDIVQGNTGNQLPYVPLHRINLHTQAEWRKMHLALQAGYTSSNYISLDNMRAIPAFWLWNLQISQQINIAQKPCSITLQINNLFNTSYQMYYLRAMPLRHFQVLFRCQIGK